MKLLDAVNSVLREIGQPPINVVDENASDQDTALALNTINEERVSAIQKGFRFNTDTVTLTPLGAADDNRLLIPTDALAVALPKEEYAVRYVRVQEVDKAYVWDTSVSDWVREKMTVEMVRDLPFEHLGAFFADWVKAKAAASAYRSLRGPGPRADRLDDIAGEKECLATNSEENDLFKFNTRLQSLSGFRRS